MDYESAIQTLDENGFTWGILRELFPFGDINLREGNYQKLVMKVLGLLETPEEKELLLDLLDTQNCVFLEQVWIQNEKSGEQEKPFPVHGHFITAQFQINSNIRWELRLKHRDPRGVMLKLPETELLLDRMLQAEE
ncbi:hypothetical protein JWG42_14040 [Desulfoprunum benzoelyticum]|uniref:Uncharacterized protein n=1 Tax=Desulfoprunum benzoelyticum TaxID=1506996 RepID=A0A840V9B9_9BACT|nr:hypothetical protein [Desulfoprunum benzoelyticum]MBB5349521.1 hypothetical protein [Desulfoprunum benzoelyticum]MBM9531276.1 hypothetical protein [Desulfoprunum benzoelyticum]